MNQDKIIELERTICNSHSNIAGIVVLRNDRTVYERYFNDCTADSRVHIYSVTKSIVSLLIGIAIDKGYIQDVNQIVLDFFPDYQVKKREKAIQNITIEHLLTMTAPYKYKVPPYVKYFTSEDFVKFTLDLLGGKGQIGKFKYTPLIGPDILSGILMKVTGKSVLDFATEHLFSPLGITVADQVVFHTKEEQLEFNQATNISGWVTDQRGVNTGGWGLTLAPTDMVKIGQLLLNDGVWKGEQIISANWVRNSTAVHSCWKKQNLSYGYLWWVENSDGYAAVGDGGNVIYVSPKNNMVISIAALFVPKAMDGLAFIKKYIEPIFEDENIGDVS